MNRTFIHVIWDRWANLHPFIRFLILLLVAAALGLLAVQPAYRRFKSWRTARNLVAAQQAVADVHMDEARDLSLSVLRTGNSCIEAFRILEKSTAALRDPRHGDIARALMAHPEGSDEDRLTGFLSLAPDVPLGLLGQAWVTLSPKCQQDARFATAFADRLIAAQRYTEAASVLLAVPQEARTPTVEHRLIRVLIGSGRREGYDEAQRLIAAGCPSDGQDITAWLDLLELIPPVSLQARLLDPLRKTLESPRSGDAARRSLMLARLDYASQFGRRAALLDETIERWKEPDPEALARFLSDLGLDQRLLDTLPAERVATHPGLFGPLLKAMERTGAWPQALLLLDAHAALLPKFEELAHRAVAASKTDDSPGRAQAWNGAIREAKSNPLATAFLKLHRIAADAGLQTESEQALVEAIRLGRGPLPLYADVKPLLNSLAQQGRENTLLEICTIYLSFEPGNPVLLTQYAYLAVLNKLDEPKTILKAMEVLSKGFPKELPIQCVLATVYLCDNQPAKAAETLDRLELDPAQLPPGYRAAFLTTQALNQRIPKDDPQITGFPWKSLLPSERRKFTELIQAVKP